jgi:hypothetical protein
MAELTSGQILKMKTDLKEPVEYTLPIGNEFLGLNQFLDKKLSLNFTGMITCVECGRSIKKSFNQGYCYPCFQSKASCDLCIMSPERCHFAAGTCREPKWGETNCNIDHFVYLANSSGVKVGITRHSQVPTRWMDQGAVQAIPVFRVNTRHESGILEVAFKEHITDKTHWQRMLKGEPEAVDMLAMRNELLPKLQAQLARFVERFGAEHVETLSDTQVTSISYPVRRYPTKVKSLSFDKMQLVEGTLQGIKGQYLIFDTGVINLRKFAGYTLTVSTD